VTGQGEAEERKVVVVGNRSDGEAMEDQLRWLRKHHEACGGRKCPECARFRSVEIELMAPFR